MSPSPSTIAERPGTRSSVRSASQPFATPSRSNLTPGSRTTVEPRGPRRSDQRRLAGRGVVTASPCSAARRASSIATSTSPSVRPSATRDQSRTAARVGWIETSGSGAALRRDRSEEASKRVRREDQAARRSSTRSASRSRASAGRSSINDTLTWPPIIGRRAPDGTAAAREACSRGAPWMSNGSGRSVAARACSAMPIVIVPTAWCGSRPGPVAWAWAGRQRVRSEARSVPAAASRIESRAGREPAAAGPT